jgi:hypothetical protein
MRAICIARNKNSQSMPMYDHYLDMLVIGDPYQVAKKTRWIPYSERVPGTHRI